MKRFFPASRWFRAALALLAMACLGQAAAPRPRRKIRRPVVKVAPQAAAKIENAGVLAPFFKALERLEDPAGERVVRIMHFGDSHTAADYWTGRIRCRLQARFGDL